jgi:hypothetical protein
MAMSKHGLAIAVLGVLAAPALAQQYQGGNSASQVNAYTQRLADYGTCLRFTGNARRCGAPPEAVQALQQRHTQQQDVRVTDYYCVDRHIRGGQPWGNAMQACTRYQPQQSIGGYGQELPDATERDILDAQTGAMNAFSQCVQAGVPGAYCGPPP